MKSTNKPEKGEEKKEIYKRNVFLSISFRGFFLSLLQNGLANGWVSVSRKPFADLAETFLSMQGSFLFFFFHPNLVWNSLFLWFVHLPYIDTHTHTQFTLKWPPLGSFLSRTHTCHERRRRNCLLSMFSSIEMHIKSSNAVNLNKMFYE